MGVHDQISGVCDSVSVIAAGDELAHGTACCLRMEIPSASARAFSPSCSLSVSRSVMAITAWYQFDTVLAREGGNGIGFGITGRSASAEAAQRE